jgi:voltage-gated potassium channel
MTATAPGKPHSFSAYQFFILCICLWAVVSIGAGMFLSLSPDTQLILHVADIVACGIFFIDFLVTLYQAENKVRYFYTWGWIDLVSSIPAIGPLRFGRFGRVFRILRVMRAIRSVRAIAMHVTTRRAQGAFLAAVLLSLMVLTTASIAILHVETAPASNIKTAQDAMWWAISTLTTIGSPDAFPVTQQGRLIAAVVMAIGVGVFGVISGVAAYWFLTPVEEEEDKDIVELKELIEQLKAQVGGRDQGSP